MKIFRHKENGFLYYIQQATRSKSISRNKDCDKFYAQPYKTNPSVQPILLEGNPPVLTMFEYVFEDRIGANKIARTCWYEYYVWERYGTFKVN